MQTVVVCEKIIAHRKNFRFFAVSYNSRVFPIPGDRDNRSLSLRRNVVRWKARRVETVVAVGSEIGQSTHTTTDAKHKCLRSVHSSRRRCCRTLKECHSSTRGRHIRLMSDSGVSPNLGRNRIGVKRARK